MHCFKSLGERKRCVALMSGWDTLTSFQTETRALGRRPGKLDYVVQPVTTCFLKPGWWWNTCHLATALFHLVLLMPSSLWPTLCHENAEHSVFESYPKDGPPEGKGHEGNIEYSFIDFWSLSSWENIQGWGNFGVLFSQSLRCISSWWDSQFCQNTCRVLHWGATFRAWVFG